MILPISQGDLMRHLRYYLQLCRRHPIATAIMLLMEAGYIVSGYYYSVWLEYTTRRTVWSRPGLSFEAYCSLITGADGCTPNTDIIWLSTILWGLIGVAVAAMTHVLFTQHSRQPSEDRMMRRRVIFMAVVLPLTLAVLAATLPLSISG